MNKNGIEKENENITLLGNLPKNTEMGEHDPIPNQPGLADSCWDQPERIRTATLFRSGPITPEAKR